jgi:hypothetical protein
LPWKLSVSVIATMYSHTATLGSESRIPICVTAQVTHRDKLWSSPCLFPSGPKAAKPKDLRFASQCSSKYYPTKRGFYFSFLKLIVSLY